MIKNKLLLLLLFISLASSAADARTTKYVNGFWLEANSFARAEKFVRDGIFSTDFGRQADEVVDLKGAYIIPSLGEAHNHNLQNCNLVPQFAKRYVDQGILYSAQLFATDPHLAACQALFSNPEFPSVAFARIGVTSSTGHPIGLARDSARAANIDMSLRQITDGMLIADTAREFTEKWRMQKAKSTDFVKVILIDTINSARNNKDPSFDGYNGVTPEVLSAVVSNAHESGLRVVAHVDTADDFRFAVGAGVDAIGHLPGYRIAEGKNINDYRLKDATVRLAAKKNIVVIPTMAASSYFLQSHPEAEAKILRNYRDNLKLLKKHAVTVLTGSDRFEGGVIDEINALATAKVFTPLELVQMSAIASPKWMFPKRKVGCFGTGCEATFNAYAHDPTVDLGTLKQPEMVVRFGRHLRIGLVLGNAQRRHK